MAVHGSIVMLMALLASLLMIASPAKGSYPAGDQCKEKQGLTSGSSTSFAFA
jgi:hypothetical protein